MAIDDDGNALTWDGRSWSAPVIVSGDGLPLLSISCVSASFCMAADEDGDIQTWNGNSWSDPALLDPGNYGDGVAQVQCISASLCIAAGLGYVYRWQGSLWSAWNGTSWSIWTSSGWSTPPSLIDSNYFWSFSCASASFCAGVDAFGNAYTWNGISWSDAINLNQDNALISVSCASASFCMAVGEPGNAYTWNGVSWSSEANPFDPGPVGSGGGYPNWVSCPAVSDCVAVDANADALTWNGTSWSAPIHVGQQYGLASISCPSASFCAAVGAGYAFTTTTPNTATPTVSVTDDAAGVAVDGEFTFSAAVTGSGPNPSGTVTWMLTGPGSPKCADSTLSLGKATCTVRNAQAGHYTASADYLGNSSYSPALGTDDTADIAKATSKTSLKLSTTKVTYGDEQVEKLSVTVTPESKGSTPAGTVKITDSATTMCIITLSGGKGSCSLTATQLGAGTYSLEGLYSGNSFFNTSSSAQLLIIAAKATSKTSLKLSTTKVTYGDEQVEKLSVTVTPESKGSTPAGTVKITDSATTMCIITLSGGKGSCSLKATQLGAGTYSLVGIYVANPTNFEGSTSTKRTLSVAE